MKYCSQCGQEINEKAVICVKCGCAVTNQLQTTTEQDEASTGLTLLSVLIPLFGIIYWAAKAKETPKRAKTCGIAALVSWGLSILIGVVLGLSVLSYL